MSRETAYTISAQFCIWMAYNLSLWFCLIITRQISAPLIEVAGLLPTVAIFSGIIVFLTKAVDFYCRSFSAGRRRVWLAYQNSLASAGLFLLPVIVA